MHKDLDQHLGISPHTIAVALASSCTTHAPHRPAPQEHLAAPDAVFVPSRFRVVAALARADALTRTYQSLGCAASLRSIPCADGSPLLDRRAETASGGAGNDDDVGGVAFDLSPMLAFKPWKVEVGCIFCVGCCAPFRLGRVSHIHTPLVVYTGLHKNILPFQLVCHSSPAAWCPLDPTLQTAQLNVMEVPGMCLVSEPAEVLVFNLQGTGPLALTGENTVQVRWYIGFVWLTGIIITRFVHLEDLITLHVHWSTWLQQPDSLACR